MSQKSISYAELLELQSAAEERFAILLAEHNVEETEWDEFLFDYVQNYIDDDMYTSIASYVEQNK